MDERAASVYEEFFVPALFAAWPDRVLDAAEVGPGDRVLDVACGTGVLARAALSRVGASGSVVGYDASPGMLAVARRTAPAVTWDQGRAEDLPYSDASFDAVVSQFGLMFFDDRPAALREMARVLRAGGRVAVAVWSRVEDSPGYAALVDLLGRAFGKGAADALRAPFALGEGRTLLADFAAAGLPAPRVMTSSSTARFPSIAAWITTDVRGWSPLGGQLTEAQFQDLLARAETDLRRFAGPDGRVQFPIVGHVASLAPTR